MDGNVWGLILHMVNARRKDKLLAIVSPETHT